MGWGSAGGIIEPLLTELVEMDKRNPGDALGKRMTPAIVKLISTLQANDWDTEEETLAEFKHVPWIVAAFEACDVTMTCRGACEDCGEICGKERL